MSSASDSPNARAVVGIDFGAEKTTVSFVVDATPTVSNTVRNDGLHISTPTCVAFADSGARKFGAEALHEAGQNSSGTVPHLAQLCGISTSEFAGNETFAAAGYKTSTGPSLGELMVSIQDRTLRTEQLAAFFLNRVRGFAETHRDRLVAQDAEIGDVGRLRYVFAVPGCMSATQKQGLVDAARIAGLGDDVVLVPLATSLAAAYRAKHADRFEGEGGKVEHILLIDLGYTKLTAAVARMDAEGCHVLASDCSQNVCAGAFDRRLFAHFAKECEEKHRGGEKLERNSRIGRRLMKNCIKVKTGLSAVSSSSMYIDNVAPGKDARFTLTREELEKLCAPELKDLTSLITSVLEASGVAQADVASAELVGGASRMPAVKAAVARLLAGADQSAAAEPDLSKLTFTLDVAMAAGTGAGLLGSAVFELGKKTTTAPPTTTAAGSEEQDSEEQDSEATSPSTPPAADDKSDAAADGTKDKEGEGEGETKDANARVIDASSTTTTGGMFVATPLVVAAAAAEASAPAGMSDEDIAAAQALEVTLAAADAAAAREAKLRHELESYVYALRDELDGKFEKELKGDDEGAAITALLDAAEAWLWDGDAAPSGDACAAKLTELVAAVNAACPSYSAAKAVEVEAKAAEERKAEAEAAVARKEREARIAAGEEDHDYRKLKTPQRMKLAMKQKDEGTELFRGRNYEKAAVRYVKALQHCDKFVDLDAEAQGEVAKLKTSCYLNLAACWIGLKKWRKVVDNCCRALEIDETSVKALFRRAKAYAEQKEWGKAEADVKAAKKLLGDKEDKNVNKLAAKIQKAKDKQKAKRKKMAKAMFA